MSPEQKEFYIRLMGWQIVDVRDEWPTKPEYCWVNNAYQPNLLYSLDEAYQIEIEIESANV